MSDASTPSYLLGPEECETFLRAFEDGSLPADQWTHEAHFAMATVYLARYGESVLPHTRAAIRNYLLARSKDLSYYHETLTIFWLAIVAENTQTLGEIAQHESVRANCAAFGRQSKLPQSYYSFDVFKSTDASIRWIPPDLKPLTIPFPTEI